MSVETQNEETQNKPEAAPVVSTEVEVPVVPEAPVAEEVPAAPVAEVVAEAPVAETSNVVAASGEPRKRYHGQLIVAEEPRIVGEQTFQSITLEDGSTMDLNEVEYRTEVKVSFPPNA